ncbi:GNAT family N-acetyltransferase [Jeotgalibacillus aurantiacus]|uniref:GNAT family N-acetyltransferase n=1 Tax=Jeotgalibacillus aurantiacus TaxID=2763266 RepID=UPI001D0A239F|nr:GNAT family N-acetyltransferase [Jeotgalibacillus aurantiacus]
MEIRLLDSNEISNLIDFVHQVEEIDENCNDFLEVSPHFFKVMKDKKVICYGIFEEDKLIAYYLVHFEGVHPYSLPKGINKECINKTAEIFSFLVHSSFRGRSLQKILTEKAELEAINRGFLYMLVKVKSNNEYSKNNFEKMGYITDTQKNGLRTYYKSLR